MIIVLVFQDNGAIREACCENLARAAVLLQQNLEEGARFLCVRSKKIWW